MDPMSISGAIVHLPTKSASVVAKDLRSYVNDALRPTEPWKLVACAVVATYGTVRLVDLYYASDKSVYERLRSWFISHAKRLPSVQKEIQTKTAAQRLQLEHELLGKQAKYVPTPHSALPATGFSHDEIVVLAQNYREMETINWREVGISGAVYSGADDITKLISLIYTQFAWSNPLHADLFPSVRLMEAEIISMCCNMFNGGENACGSVTTGGTESILLACKAHRDRARALRGVKRPNMVVSETVHAAFEKASQMMNISIRRAPIDKITYQVDVHALRKLIDGNTCMIAVSAPGFPHGIVDPVEQVGRIALDRNIPLHVDCCLGGFLLPFMQRAGFHDIEPFDFKVSGVTSISADTHKYGFAPKGTSVIMYRDHSYLHYQYSVSAKWSGGIYASPSMCGSRAGALIAACWAVMLYHGEAKYVDTTRRIVALARELTSALRKVPHIYVLGEPKVSVVAFGSNDFNIYRLNDEMASRGWRLNALQYPSSLHIACTLVHTLQPDFVRRFVDDLRQCVDHIMQTPDQPGANSSGSAGVYGMSHAVPDQSILDEFVWIYLDTVTKLKPSTQAKYLLTDADNAESKLAFA